MKIEEDRTTNPKYIEDATRIGTAAQNTADWMMRTFFQKDTWEVRQLGAYGIMIPKKNKSDGIDLYDLPSELEAMLVSITAELGDRFSYFQSAYKFPDQLWCAAREAEIVLHPDFVGRPNPNTDARRILTQSQIWVTELTPKLKTFLDCDAKKAFSIHIDINDIKNPTYLIEDLVLNPADIRAKWAELQAAVFPFHI